MEPRVEAAIEEFRALVPGLMDKGNVPGAPGGYVVIRKAVAAKPEPQPQLQEKPKKGKK